MALSTEPPVYSPLVILLLGCGLLEHHVINWCSPCRSKGSLSLSLFLLKDIKVHGANTDSIRFQNAARGRRDPCKTMQYQAEPSNSPLRSQNRAIYIYIINISPAHSKAHLILVQTPRRQIGRCDLWLAWLPAWAHACHRRESANTW